MIVKETVNLEEIKAILCDPVIYDTISSDECPLIGEFEPPLNGFLYYGGYVDNKIIALAVYHKYLDGDKYHPQVLPEFREKYAKKFVEQSLKLKGTPILYAVIPDLYKSVLNFALKFGFKIVDKKLNSFVKNGKSYNDNILRLIEWDLSETP